MKNIAIVICASFLLLGLLPSCNNLLTVEPQDFISQSELFSSEKTANTALTGVYQMLGNSSLYGRNLINELDTYSNDLCFNGTSTPSGISCWQHTASDATVGNIWRYLYEGVNRANIFLDNVNSVPNLSDSTRNSWVAQAKFLRALYYYNLVQNWGAVPLKLHQTLTPQDIHVPVSPAADVFNAIHADLDSAIKYLPTRTKYPSLEQSSRPSKTTAMALQARAYLRKAGVPFNLDPQNSYTKAAKYAGDVIASAVHQLNPSFKQVFVNLITDKYDPVYNENLMEVEFTYTNTYTNVAGFPMLGYPFKFNGVDVIMVGSSTLTTAKLFDLYERVDSTVVAAGVTSHYPKPKDERRDWTIQSYKLSGSVYGGAQTKISPKVDATIAGTDAKNKYYRDDLTARFVGKWRRDFESSATLTSYGSPCNFPLIRYSEVLLIFAEADVMAQNKVTDLAFKYLNLVKARAKATELLPGDAKATDPKLFLLELQDERARELFGEGHHRHDIIRWGLFDATFANLPVNDPVIQPWGRSVQGIKFLLLPYPERETSSNNAMKGVQNPGW